MGIVVGCLLSSIFKVATVYSGYFNGKLRKAPYQGLQSDRSFQPRSAVFNYLLKKIGKPTWSMYFSWNGGRGKMPRKLHFLCVTEIENDLILMTY